MKKALLFLTTLILLGNGVLCAAPAKQGNKITNLRIVQSSKDTTVMYSGIKFFIPAGQTIILGKNVDGSVILRGNHLKNVKIDEGILSSTGFVLLTIRPQTQVITVTRGDGITVQDANGRTAFLSQGASVSTNDIRTTVFPSTSVTQSTKVESNTQDQEEAPAFVAETQVSSAASEQATQDVYETEEVLSPSAPH